MNMKITWIGHAAFKIEEDDKVVFIDPWLKDGGNPVATLSLNEIDKADLIIITHGHGDHGFEDGIKIAKKTGAALLSVYETASEAQSKGVEKTIGANIGGEIKVDDVMTVYLTPAVHSTHTSTPTGVVVKFKEKSVYHAGDTGIFMTMKLIGELYKPDVALLPIGAHFTMGPPEAAKAVELIKPKVVIPMHYKTFPVLKPNADEFVELAKDLADIKVIEPGETVEI